MPPHQDATDRAQAALTAARDIAYEWDLASDAISWHGPVGTVLGIADRAAIGTGRALAGRINPEDLPQRQHCLSDSRDGRLFECEYRLRAEDGRFHWVQDRGRAELDSAGRAMRMRGVLRVVTSRKAAELRLEQLVNFDELTGHLSKARLRDAVQRRLERTDIANVGAYLAVGIDNMTMINDAFGYEAADGVIIEVGRRLAACLGAADVIGRIGGDRFGVLLGDCAEEMIAAAAERLRSAISDAPVATAVGPIYITASLGSIAFPRQASTAQDVMTRAETALGEAKRAGRDCVAAYQLTEAQRSQHRAGMAVGERVQRALKQGRLLFAFQPVVHSGSGMVDYYECLLRMREEDGAIVAAGQFVPMIEQLGLIRNIDRFVLERAVEELDACAGFNLGFNISGLTAADHPWLRAFASLLAGKPEIANRIVIEITETTALRDFEDSGRFVKTLRDLGCRVALDDFGAGFTSVRHLQALGVDTVKIDGSFVRNLVDRPENQVFLRHLLGLLHGLGLKTVAECVETAEEMAILRQQGVDYMQGYFFGKPSLERAWSARLVGDSHARATRARHSLSSAAC
ncbi:MAG TPA: GGDEF and EAL domain-containing protein [Stellaceae bacterium]|nr:GGDEF and EAL domain-containing protein [Stellaceae bacterium]